MKAFALSDLPKVMQTQVVAQLHPKTFPVSSSNPRNRCAVSEPVATMPGTPLSKPVAARKLPANTKFTTRTKGLFKWEGIPEPVLELRFAPPRRWRFDYAWPAHKIALEVEGGIWTGGRHTRGAGFVKDMEKYNAAAVLGWRVVRCTPSNLKSPETQAMLAKLLAPLEG